MTRRRRRTRTTIEAEVLLNLCHLERNKIIGEADDLVQSKDPYAVISANGASGSSPPYVDVAASIENELKVWLRSERSITTIPITGQ